MLISNYEFEFKTRLKEASSSDEQYKNWMEKCNQRNMGTYDNFYQIDTEGFLPFKNRFYVPNQNSIKKIIFK